MKLSKGLLLALLAVVTADPGAAQQDANASAIDERLHVQCDGQYACIEQQPLSAADAAISYPYPLPPRSDEIGAVAAAPPPSARPASSR